MIRMNGVIIGCSDVEECRDEITAKLIELDMRSCPCFHDVDGDIEYDEDEKVIVLDEKDFKNMKSKLNINGLFDLSDYYEDIDNNHIREDGVLTSVINVNGVEVLLNLKEYYV